MLAAQAFTPIRGHEGWEQRAFFYRCGDWEKPRCFVAVRGEKVPEQESTQLELRPCKEYETFCCVTSERLSPWEAHKQYGKREIWETWIGEAKNQMGLGKNTVCALIAGDSLPVLMNLRIQVVQSGAHPSYKA